MPIQSLLTKTLGAVTAALFLRVWLQGCTTRETSRWAHLSRIIEVSSRQAIEASFERPPRRFTVEELSAKDARFLFVTAYPYPGIAIIDVYCFEQIRSDLWQLRTVLTIVNPRLAVVSFAAEGDSVQVSCDGEVVLRVNSEKTSRSQFR
jgi:hypothetical protein